MSPISWSEGRCLSALFVALSIAAVWCLWCDTSRGGWVLLLSIFLFSPNLVALLLHGTPDLLLAAAAGHTVDPWTTERLCRRSFDLSGVKTRSCSASFTCALCLQDAEIGMPIHQLPCGHSFCAGGDCHGVRPWLKLHGSCPICRASLKTCALRQCKQLDLTGLAWHGMVAVQTATI